MDPFGKKKKAKGVRPLSEEEIQKKLYGDYKPPNQEEKPVDVNVDITQTAQKLFTEEQPASLSSPAKKKQVDSAQNKKRYDDNKRERHVAADEKKSRKSVTEKETMSEHDLFDYTSSDDTVDDTGDEDKDTLGILGDEDSFKASLDESDLSLADFDVEEELRKTREGDDTLVFSYGQEMEQEDVADSEDDFESDEGAVGLDVEENDVADVSFGVSKKSNKYAKILKKTEEKAAALEQGQVPAEIKEANEHAADSVAFPHSIGQQTSDKEKQEDRYKENNVAAQGAAKSSQSDLSADNIDWGEFREKVRNFPRGGLFAVILILIALVIAFNVIVVVMRDGNAPFSSDEGFDAFDSDVMQEEIVSESDDADFDTLLETEPSYFEETTSPQAQSSIAATAAITSQRQQDVPEEPVSHEMKESEFYTLQVCVYEDAKRANELAGEFADSGYQAYYERLTTRTGKTLFAVYVGQYPSQSAAQEGLSQFKSTSFFKKFPDSFIRWVD